jgi:hypothetical protein
MTWGDKAQLIGVLIQTITLLWAIRQFGIEQANRLSAQSEAEA